MLCALSTLFIPWKRYARGNPEYRVDAKERASASGWTLKSAMRTRMYWGLVQVFFFTSTAMYTVTVQTVVYFIDTGFSPITAATAFGFIGMFSVCSVAMSGILGERYGFRQTVTASFVGTASGIMVLFALTYAPWASLLVLYVLVFGFCQGMRGPIVSTIATRYFAGARVATIYGTIYATNALGAAFGSFDRWEADFRRTGMSLAGGSGWCVLVYNLHTRSLHNHWAWDHMHGAIAGVPLLALDMYEHSFHMDYGTAAAKYVDAFFRNIDWEVVDRRYAAALRGGG